MKKKKRLQVCKRGLADSNDRGHFRELGLSLPLCPEEPTEVSLELCLYAITSLAGVGSLRSLPVFGKACWKGAPHIALGSPLQQPTTGPNCVLLSH